MATVSERARELAKELEMVTYPHSEHVLDKLEQALLAERQDVWATAIKAIKGYKSLPGLNRAIAITALRAAAETEKKA